jgi:hypothetical protein
MIYPLSKHIIVGTHSIIALSGVFLTFGFPFSPLEDSGISVTFYTKLTKPINYFKYLNVN